MFKKWLIRNFGDFSALEKSLREDPSSWTVGELCARSDSGSLWIANGWTYFDWDGGRHIPFPWRWFLWRAFVLGQADISWKPPK